MVRIRAWLAQAWDLVGADLPLFSVAAFLTISLSLLSAFILALPLAAGLCIMLSEKLQGNKPELAHLWEGLTSRFPATITVWIVYLLVSAPFDSVNYYLQTLRGSWPAIGVLIVLLGAWIVATPMFFTLPLIADRDVSARDAFRMSWAQVRPRLGGIFAATIVYSLVVLLGVFACGVGVIITLPVALGALTLAYRELFADFEIPQMTPIKDPAMTEGDENAN